MCICFPVVRNEPIHELNDVPARPTYPIDLFVDNIALISSQSLASILHESIGQ